MNRETIYIYIHNKKNEPKIGHLEKQLPEITVF